MLEGKLKRSYAPLAATGVLPDGKCMFVWLLHKRLQCSSRKFFVEIEQVLFSPIPYIVSFTTGQIQADTGQSQASGFIYNWPSTRTSCMYDTKLNSI